MLKLQNEWGVFESLNLNLIVRLKIYLWYHSDFVYIWDVFFLLYGGCVHIWGDFFLLQGGCVHIWGDFFLLYGGCFHIWGVFILPLGAVFLSEGSLSLIDNMPFIQWSTQKGMLLFYKSIRDWYQLCINEPELQSLG